MPEICGKAGISQQTTRSQPTRRRSPKAEILFSNLKNLHPQVELRWLTGFGQRWTRLNKNDDVRTRLDGADDRYHKLFVGRSSGTFRGHRAV